MKWSILSERKWLGMGPFFILTNIDGGDVEEIGHFQIEKLRLQRGQMIIFVK